MRFVARINLSRDVPRTRAYLHATGLTEVYSSEDPVIKARDYILEILERDRDRLREFNYVLAAIYGNKVTWSNDRKVKVIDFFGFDGINGWPGNPDVSAWIVRNGVYIPQREITCGDTLILLGKEEEYRRTTKSLEDYMCNPPHIPGINDGKPIQTIDN